MSGFQSPITIGNAMEKIKRNEFLLPAFQREFVWKSGQIETLFNSLMKEYPISSMLFWKVRGDTKKNFKFYKFLDQYCEWFKIHNEHISSDAINDFYAVLDGQQRLTSLYIGLCGSYAYKEYRKAWIDSETNLPSRILYLNISASSIEKEEYKFEFLRVKDTERKDIYVDSEGSKWFRVGYILSLHNNSKKYDIDDFCEENNIEKEGKKILKQLEKVIFTIPNINYYEEDEQTPDKAVNIFIRINSGGTYLSFSDILMSIAVANWKNIDARTEIHQLVDNIRAKGYTIDKDYILKAFLYLYHKDIRFQINSFNNEFIERIEANWNDIRDAIISLFDLIKSFGLIDYTLTAKNATLPILYYIYHRNIYRGYSDKVAFQDERKTIKKWLLTILVRQIFSSQTDSVLSQSRRGFTIDIEKEKIDENISSFPFDKINDEIKKFSDISEDNIEELLLNQKDKQYTFSILALLYPNLDYKNNNFHQDHLHPASKYDSLSQDDKDKYGWNIYNSILNLQMLGANENESKNNSDLKDWVNREVKDKGDSYRDSFLEDHIIPDVDLDINNFSVFVEARKNILVNKLKKLLSQ